MSTNASTFSFLPNGTPKELAPPVPNDSFVFATTPASIDWTVRLSSSNFHSNHNSFNELLVKPDTSFGEIAAVTHNGGVPLGLHAPFNFSDTKPQSSMEMLIAAAAALDDSSEQQSREQQQQQESSTVTSPLPANSSSNGSFTTPMTATLTTSRTSNSGGGGGGTISVARSSSYSTATANATTEATTLRRASSNAGSRKRAKDDDSDDSTTSNQRDVQFSSSASSTLQQQQPPPPQQQQQQLTATALSSAYAQQQQQQQPQQYPSLRSNSFGTRAKKPKSSITYIGDASVTSSLLSTSSSVTPTTTTPPQTSLATSSTLQLTSTSNLPPPPPVRVPRSRLEINTLLQQTIEQRKMPYIRSIRVEKDVKGVLLDITDFLSLPQTDAARALGLPTSTLSKRWSETVPDRKWPYRTVCKIDHQLGVAMADPTFDVVTPPIERLLVERIEALAPVAIRVSKKRKLNADVIPPHLRLDLANVAQNADDEDDDE